MYKQKWFALLIALGLLASTLYTGSAAYAQGSRTFPQTGKTVSGKFLAYWDSHGGLAQQGYPISEELQEKSDTDGKTYTVQYFERAVFELHPENQPPNDVLLALLGNFLYKQKYPAGAPGQQKSTDNPRLFSETGKTLGGVFRTYWEEHGGLAQQGYPITEEFQEKSDTDGKTYTVQYFERAVFERHPENAGTQYEVLLSLLGKFRLNGKSGTPPVSQPPAACTWPLVQQNQRGETVKSVQYLLNESGAKLTVDGAFGPATLAAVRSFQTAKAVTADGIVGPKTWAVLIKTVQTGSNGQAVRAVQSQLVAKSFGTLTVDGIFGPATNTAVRAFQTAQKLTADGIVGPNTWCALVQ